MPGFPPGTASLTELSPMTFNARASTAPCTSILADKLLALFDRAQARDFVDVAALVDRFGLERLCELASEKDAGFSRSVLVEMLGSFGRFRPDEFGMSMSAYDALARAVEQWRQRLSVSRPTEPPGPSLGL
jgi:hypothetical protein